MKQILGFLIIAGCFMVSCERKHEPINYGKDSCAHCKMTIVDPRYGAELVDEKGKVFKFDDVTCMRQFMERSSKTGDNLLFVDSYLESDSEPLNAINAVYLHHETFASPMNGNYAAFRSETEAQPLKDSLGLAFRYWDDIR